MDLSNWNTKVRVEVVYGDYDALTIAFSLDDGPWYIMIVPHGEGD